ncbi:MAG: hypothetical protein IPO22_07055 [Anaerolineales bacterium]|nr:hypothetical protein [Anaerolineales bacterium]
MKLGQSLNPNPRLVISLAAVGITFVVCMMAYAIMQIYHTVQPIWVEQAAYGQAPMLAFLALINKGGYWYAVSKIGSERHLLQLLVLGALVPSLLDWFHAPLLFVTPIFTVFLGLFGWTVYKRNGNLGYAVAAMLFFCAIAQLTRHTWGIGSGFADWQSMLLLGAAALSLVNALMEPGMGWIRSFAIFISLAVLARTTATFYAAVICAPMLLLYFIEQYKRERSLKPLGMTLANVLVIIVPAAVVVIGQLVNMFLYYGSVNAWQLHQPFLVSSANIFLRLLAPFLGLPFIVACATLLVLNLLKILPPKNLAIMRVSLLAAGLGFVFVFFFTKHADVDPYFLEPSRDSLLALGAVFFVAFIVLARKNVERWFIAQTQPVDSGRGASGVAIAWWALGFLGFLLVYGYTSDVPKEAMYAVPALLIGCLTPASTVKNTTVALNRYLPAGLAVFSLICFGWNSYQNIEFSRITSPGQDALRAVQHDMARVISSLKTGIIWQSYTSIDWGIPVSLRTQYDFGEYRQYGGTDFYNKKAYWDTWYPDMPLDELQSNLYAQAVNCVDAAVILKDPYQQPAGMEDYSYSIAAYVARNVKADSNWRLVSTLDGWPDNTKYQVYMNMTPASSRSCKH